MSAISPSKLNNLQNEKANILLVDVREPIEHQQANIGGVNIPMGEIIDNINQLVTAEKVIIYCKSGQRSEAVVEALKLSNRLENLYFLSGGILAYAKDYCPELVLE